MNFKYFLYSLPLLLAGLSACSDDKLIDQNVVSPDVNEYDDTEYGVTPLDVYIEDADLRTRDISFEDGASVFVNTLWIGVFDQADGTCVENIFPSQDYKFIASGYTATGFIRVTFGGPKDGYKDKNLFMVVVANFKDVMGRKVVGGKVQDKETLENLLKNVYSWSDFNAIGVETETAFSGDHSKDCPLMAGFLNTSNVKEGTHLKVNQFQDNVTNPSNNGLLNLMPVDISFTDNSSDKVKNTLAIRWNATQKRYVDETTGATKLKHKIFFRRLVANVNVNIQTQVTNGEYTGLEITEVQYRRFNMPNYVYIIERSLWNPYAEAAAQDFPTTANREYSPNFGDLDFSNITGVNGYSNDDDNYKALTDPSNKEEDYKNWQNSGVRRDADGAWNFSFQHFANKHWARKGKTISNTDEREALNQYFVQNPFNEEIQDTKYWFDALCNDEEQDDINNNASFFILKMHLLQSEKNRCAEAEFLIHEGYTSDADGNSTTEDQIRLRDFSVARNINTNYNIYVQGFDQIRTNVNGGEGTIHRPYMGGRTWQIYYANETGHESGNYAHDVHYVKGASDEDRGSYTNAIPSEGGVFKSALIIENDHPDMSFRLYGYNSAAGKIEGFNYNFPDNSFDWLKGLWPPSVAGSRYFEGYAGLVSDYGDDDPQINDILFRTFHILKDTDAATFGATKIMEYEKALAGKSKDEMEKLVESDSDLKKYYDTRMNIVEFIQYLKGDYPVYNEGIAGKNFRGEYTIVVGPRLISASQLGITSNNKGDYIRAIYFCDRIGQTDSDGCSRLVKVYSAVQDPPLIGN